AFCISKAKKVSRPPVTGRDSSRQKVTFRGHNFGFCAKCHDPYGGGRDSKTAFLQSNFATVTTVTTSRLLKVYTKYVGKPTYLPYPIEMVVTVVTVGNLKEYRVACM